MTDKNDQWFSQIAKQQGFHTQAEIQLLLKDRARLDWLEDQGKPETYEDAPHAMVWVVQSEPGVNSLRAAIDAEMTNEPRSTN